MFDTISQDSLTTVFGGQCQCTCSGGQQAPQGEQDPNAAGGDPRAAMQQPGGGGDPSQGAQPGGPQGPAPGGGFDWRKIIGLVGGFMQQFAQQA